jgi:hypothetical protein
MSAVVFMFIGMAIFLLVAGIFCLRCRWFYYEAQRLGEETVARERRGLDLLLAAKKLNDAVAEKLVPHAARAKEYIEWVEKLHALGGAGPMCAKDGPCPYRIVKSESVSGTDRPEGGG